VGPVLTLLRPALADTIIDQARELLACVGLEIHDSGVVDLLAEAGAELDEVRQRVRMPASLVDRALASAPPRIQLFDVTGAATHDLSDRHVHFTPGSAALLLVDGETGDARRPLTGDYIDYVKLVSRLPRFAAQSTAMIPADVPEAIADSYRLCLSLQYCAKPVITGAFSGDGLEVMRDLLEIVRGSAAALRARPLAVFSCCPTSPLKWGSAAVRNLRDCARAGIPAEIVPMPLAGMTAPVTPVGALIQHTAEALSGVVIAQCTSPGAPVLFGSSAGILDVRTTTTPLGAIESMMLGCAAGEIGRRLRLPTQAYMILSDAKLLDAQCGLESGMGALMAALSGINSISGPGMHDFQSSFSLEKLVVDHEICAMAMRLAREIRPQDDVPVGALIEELLRERHLVIADHTRAHLREAIHSPGPVIDRESRARWTDGGRVSLAERARREVDRHVAAFERPPLPADVAGALHARMSAEARLHGCDRLPVPNP
jgi:trimethylamine---corrinoid protein Co-methyltransferase